MCRALAMSGLTVVVLAVSSPAEARQVVYESSDGAIMARTDDSPPRRLASGVDPHVSPDGRRVAFVSRGGTQVRLVPYRGGKQRVIARGQGVGSDPLFNRTTWSADSRYVATSAVGNQITLYDTRVRRSSVLRRYRPSSNSIAGIALSPAGTRIAFSTRGIDDSSLHVMDAKPGAHATVVRRYDGADPVWGHQAGCLAFTLLVGNRYESFPSRIGFACAGARAFGDMTGSLRPVRWLSKTRMLGAQSSAGLQERAVRVNTATGQVVAISEPVQRIFDFSRDGRTMLARSNDSLTQIALDSPGAIPAEIAPGPVVASWTGSG